MIQEYCNKKGYLYFDAIDVFAKLRNDSKEINDLYVNSHLSAKGNKIVAENFYDFLKKNKLVD